MIWFEDNNETDFHVCPPDWHRHYEADVDLSIDHFKKRSSNLSSSQLGMHDI